MALLWMSVIILSVKVVLLYQYFLICLHPGARFVFLVVCRCLCAVLCAVRRVPCELRRRENGEQWHNLRTGWARSGAGRSRGTWGCTGRGNTRGAPSALHRTSSCPGSTWHMTPTGRPPTSTPWRVSDTAGRKFWRLYRTSGLKRRRVAATALCAGW